MHLRIIGKLADEMKAAQEALFGDNWAKLEEHLRMSLLLWEENYEALLESPFWDKCGIPMLQGTLVLALLMWPHGPKGKGGPAWAEVIPESWLPLLPGAAQGVN